MSALGANSYGKSGIRLVRVVRQDAKGVRRDGHHEFRDVTVAVRFEGRFEAAHAAGDNADVLPTDTMKNTVYAAARELPLEGIEEFALALSQRFLSDNRPVSAVEISISERPWARLAATAFEGSTMERKTARVRRSRERAEVESGIEGLLIAKTAQSAFAGFRRDRYTTLKETSDRILATSLTARWKHQSSSPPFAPWEAVRGTMLETFAAHDSASVQHTLYAMGQAALAAHGGLSEIHLVMPNKHHIPVDLSSFGLTNENEVFVATEEPYGLIEATVTR